MSCILHGGQAGLLSGWLLVLWVRWTCLLGECQAWLQESFRMREPKNCTARRDLYRHSDQGWEMNTALWSRCEDQMRVRETALGTATPFSQRACTGCVPNTLSSWAHPRTEKVTTKTAILMVQDEQDKNGANIFLSIKLLNLRLLMVPPFPEAEKVLLCAPSMPCTDFPAQVMLCCHHWFPRRSFSRDHESLKDMRFPKYGASHMNEWINECMKSMWSAYTFFTTRWQIFFGKSNCKLSQRESGESFSGNWMSTSNGVRFSGLPMFPDF